MKTSDSRAFVHQLVVYSLATIVVGGGMGLGSVWMRHQISLTANTNRILESQIAEVRRHSEEIRTAVAEASRRRGLVITGEDINADPPALAAPDLVQSALQHALAHGLTARPMISGTATAPAYMTSTCWIASGSSLMRGSRSSTG